LYAKVQDAIKKGKDRVRIVTETVGESLLKLMGASLDNWGSSEPIIFEPYGYEALKEANLQVFGIEGLPSYLLDKADFLLSFGADFVETWLSPVEYARKFKEMHGLKGSDKSLFFHVSPYQSITGANADLWFSCAPDSEYAVALGLLRESVRHGKVSSLSENIRAAIEEISAPYTSDKVSELSGLPPELLHKLYVHLHTARRPLILGTPTGASGASSLQTNIVANLLNLVFDPALSLIDFGDRQRVELAARRSEVLRFFSELNNGAVDLLLLNNSNPAYCLPPGSGVREALNRDNLFVVSFVIDTPGNPRYACIIVDKPLSGLH
jgi:molybdopterin-containing oxidoreductase family iron-sulfur binding subunit